MQRTKRKVVVVDNRPLARRIGGRIRDARLRAKLTQAQLAEGRYTAAYISALERGLAKPSMAALTFISERLGLATTHFLADADDRAQRRLDADLALASGRWQEAQDRFTELLDRSTDANQRADLQVGLAEALCRLDRGAEAIRAASQAAEQFRAAGSQAQAAYATYWLAYGQFLQENLVEARGLLEPLLEEVRAGLDVAPDFQFRILSALGNLASREGDHQRALAYLQEARAASEALDLPRRAAFLASIAQTYRQAGDLEGAVRAGAESLGLYRGINAQWEVVAVSNSLALTYLALGNLARARDIAEQARGLAAELRDAVNTAHISDTLARIAIAEGDLEQARSLLEQARRDAADADLVSVRVDLLETSAQLALRQEDRSGAVAALREAAEILRGHGPRAQLRRVLVESARLLTEEGDHQAATQLYEEAFASS